jgi:hypothetical protein
MTLRGRYNFPISGLKLSRAVYCVIQRMLLRRNFTGMLIPVNYAAWGLPGHEGSFLFPRLLTATQDRRADVRESFRLESRR